MNMYFIPIVILMEFLHRNVSTFRSKGVLSDDVHQGQGVPKVTSWDPPTASKTVNIDNIGVDKRSI